jgi:hypothetical protein
MVVVVVVVVVPVVVAGGPHRHAIEVVTMRHQRCRDG